MTGAEQSNAARATAGRLTEAWRLLHGGGLVQRIVRKQGVMVTRWPTLQEVPIPPAAFSRILT